MREARLSSDLPERFARLYDPNTEKFDTPLDDRGIADIDATFELAIRTYPYVLPEFKGSESNVHHLYWTEAFWLDLADNHNFPDSQTIHVFRSSTPQLAYVPLEIHRWIEASQKPPPPPDMEVMRRRNEAWVVASILLKTEEGLAKARNNYEAKKHTSRKVYRDTPGCAPVSGRLDIEEDSIEISNRDYLLSELFDRLEGWRYLAEIVEVVPEEDRFVAEPKLFSVRALRRRIKNDAMLPRVPANLLVA